MNKNCLRCGKEFFARIQQLNRGWGKFCSRNCSNKSTANKGEKSFAWKGDTISYHGIHSWLYREFGKANKCENTECLNTTNKYQWAKLKDKEYERKRENFWMLCQRCHIFYDETYPMGWNKGVSWSEDIKKKISIGTKIGMAKAGYKNH